MRGEGFHGDCWVRRRGIMDVEGMGWNGSGHGNRNLLPKRLNGGVLEKCALEFYFRWRNGLDGDC